MSREGKLSTLIACRYRSCHANGNIFITGIDRMLRIPIHNSSFFICVQRGKNNCSIVFQNFIII